MAGENISALLERDRQVILCRPGFYLDGSRFQTRQDNVPDGAFCSTNITWKMGV